MKSMIILAAMAALFSIPGKEDLLGKWETKPSAKGNVTRVLFNEDNSLEAFVNRKPFASGKYECKDGNLTFNDNGCEGKYATYKLVLFAGNDSLRFEVIDDPCTERKQGMTRLILGRIK